MSSNIATLYDRAEGYGHALGTSTAKDDTVWTVLPTVPSDPSEDLDTRHDRTLTGRKVLTIAQNYTLVDRSSGYGHLGTIDPAVEGAGTPDDDASITLASGSNVAAVSGSNVELTTTATNVNRDVDASYATSAAPSVTHVNRDGGVILSDRTSGWGHTNGASNLHD